MKRILLSICAVAALLLSSCKPSHETLVNEIEACEARLMELNVMTNESAADSLLALYEKFVEAYPKDSLAPIYLFRSADMLTNMGRTEEAVNQFDNVINNYPDFPDIAVCYCMKGMAYEQNQQYDLAKEAYEVFLNKFPDHYLAADTRAIMPYIGLSPKEMLDVLLSEADSSIIPAVTE